MIWKTEEKQLEGGKNNDLHMGNFVGRSETLVRAFQFLSLFYKQGNGSVSLPPQIPDSPSIEQQHHFTTCKVPELPVRYACIQK